MSGQDADIAQILARRHDNGADYWATPDGRISKGSPFTTLDCALMLKDLGMDPTDPVLKGTADLVFRTLRDDGRFAIAPHGAIYPCHTINAVRALCHLGYAEDPRLRGTFDHLARIEEADGGWRCRKFSYGRGPETDCSNPGPTLAALDALRFVPLCHQPEALDAAVDFLLDHWVVRAPIGPCHFGIGSLFLQVAYPFSSYNLFFYVYVLSFHERARRDPRFLEALSLLESTLDDGRVVVQRPHQKLRSLAFCRRGEVSDLATGHYLEIRRNLEEGPRLDGPAPPAGRRP
ncbi:hypothetical protein [Arthrobacter sp. Ld5]|uniref:hypothetical protein n=1 Tax=Arthrobacter sp. Ld5 TaxID=649152 RepID=UPI003EBB6128